MPATATFSYGQRGKRADLSELLHYGLQSAGVSFQPTCAERGECEQNYLQEKGLKKTRKRLFYKEI